MHLDETMLQSNTAITLVKFIDELMKLVESDVYPDISVKKYAKLKNSYYEITEKHIKAVKRRSIRYR